MILGNRNFPVPGTPWTTPAIVTIFTKSSDDTQRTRYKRHPSRLKPSPALPKTKARVAQTGRLTGTSVTGTGATDAVATAAGRGGRGSGEKGAAVGTRMLLPQGHLPHLPCISSLTLNSFPHLSHRSVIIRVSPCPSPRPFTRALPVADQTRRPDASE